MILAIKNLIIEKEKPVLIATVGISGSGKSYLSEKLSKELGFLNINNDDLRKSIFGISQWGEYSFDNNERIITNARMALLSEFIKTKRNIVISNINLSLSRLNYYKKFAEDNGYQFVILLFDVYISIALNRNYKRTEMKLSDHVIADQYIKFNKIIDNIKSNFDVITITEQDQE